jgi:tyrosyl-tRNA synthetase
MIFVSSLVTLLTKVYPDSYSLVTPQILKSAVAAALNALLVPIQEAFHASSEWQEIALKAYPPPAKKEKKVKQKGTQHPRLRNDTVKAPGSEETS